MTQRFVYTTPDDPLARPLVEQLTEEYERRYGEFFTPGTPREMQKYPARLFTPAEGGNFLLLLDGGVAVSGGAFKRYDDATAEFKRVWTHALRRREGLARRVLVELEAQAWRQGYRRVYLTTGFRQPEAAGLYRTHGYTQDRGPESDDQPVRRLFFSKTLLPPGMLPVRAAPAAEVRA